jgi:transcription-repair coupling factor (superfamily II helicase)
VVHESHGIGRYQGLVHLDLGEGETEFLHLEYAGGDKLYVPVSQLHLISRYSGAEPELVELHKLGTDRWDRAKRAPRSRCATPPPNCSRSTPGAPRGRAHAFSLQAARPRGLRRRLRLRGDARPGRRHRRGGRRHEVRQADGPPGLRRRRLRQDRGGAARRLRRRDDGKQVAVLAPTTLLAEQHFHTFSDRFADWPVKIAELSRFRSAKEQTRPCRNWRKARSTSPSARTACCRRT